MDEKELKRWETTYRQKTGKNPVTVPKKGAPEDIPTFLKLGEMGKQAMTDARKLGDESRARKCEQYIENLKRTMRARAIQRELNRVEGKPAGFLSPWPDVP